MLLVTINCSGEGPEEGALLKLGSLEGDEEGCGLGGVLGPLLGSEMLLVTINDHWRRLPEPPELTIVRCQLPFVDKPLNVDKGCLGLKLPLFKLQTTCCELSSSKVFLNVFRSSHALS